jgi:hypothetical protein
MCDLDLLAGKLISLNIYLEKIYVHTDECAGQMH